MFSDNLFFYIGFLAPSPLTSGLIVLHVTFPIPWKDAVNTSFTFLNLTQCQLGDGYDAKIKTLVFCP